jgi:uncharacterized protein YkwD
MREDLRRSDRRPSSRLDVNALEQRVVDLTNRQRANRRLRPVAADDALSDAARRHSEDMLRRRFFAHINPDGQTPTDRIAAAVRRRIGASAENIWMRSGGVAETALSMVIEEAFAQMMESPVHRNNILNARYTHIGVGVAVAASQLRMTQLFARFER